MISTDGSCSVTDSRGPSPALRFTAPAERESPHRNAFCIIFGVTYVLCASSARFATDRSEYRGAIIRITTLQPKRGTLFDLSFHAHAREFLWMLFGSNLRCFTSQLVTRCIGELSIHLSLWSDNFWVARLLAHLLAFTTSSWSSSLIAIQVPRFVRERREPGTRTTYKTKTLILNNL